MSDCARAEIDDHAAEAVAHDQQKGVPAVLAPPVAVVARPSQQFSHGSRRHPLPRCLPPPEGRVRNSVAEAEI